MYMTTHLRMVPYQTSLKIGCKWIVLVRKSIKGDCTEPEQLRIIILLYGLPFRMWMIMDVYNSVSFVALIKIWFFAVPSRPYFANHVHMLVSYFIHCFLSSLLPSVCPVSDKLCNSSFLIRDSKYAFLFLIISIQFVLIFS